MVLLLWQHGDMTGIPPQVVYSNKCFNGKRIGKVQEAVIMVLPYSSVFWLTTETVD